MVGIGVSLISLLGLLVVGGIPLLILIWVFVDSRKGWRALSRSGASWRGELPPLAPRSEELDSALLAFVEAWGSRFGENQRHTLKRRMRFLWITSSPGDSFEHRGQQLRGITHGFRTIEFAARAWGFGRTALFHELVHWALWNLTGEPDPDHTGDSWKGWTAEHDALIESLKMRFRDVEEGTLEAPELETAICGSCERKL